VLVRREKDFLKGPPSFDNVVSQSVSKRPGVDLTDQLPPSETVRKRASRKVSEPSPNCTNSCSTL
jgi:hypothetical protein